MIVFKLELTTMEPGHRRSPAEAEARTGLRAALLETNEALHHTAAVGVGNTGPAIGNAERDALAIIAGPNHDLGRDAVHLAARPGIFDRIVDEIGQGLANQLAITAHRRRCGSIDLERDTLLIRNRLVKLANVAGDFGGVEFSHILARLPGFGARDH